MKKKFMVLLAIAALFIVGCGDSAAKTTLNDNENNDADEVSDEETSDADGPMVDSDDNEGGGGVSVDDFDPENPGYTVEFTIMDTNMMSNSNAMAVGYIMKTAREDLEPDNSVQATLDTCVVGESTPDVPTCKSDEDCAPEQRCVRKKDKNSGKELENTEHCETPNREPLDVGPIQISGFNNGPHTFLYEPNDRVYKLNGEGDGSIDHSLIVYDSDYHLYAEDPTPEDLNSFTASFKMPPALEITYPESVPGGMGGTPALPIDNTRPITLKWSGNNGTGYIDITLTAITSFVAAPATIACRAVDDGEFTVPLEFASQLVFSDSQLNMSMAVFTRHTEAPLTGQGVSSGAIVSEQLIMRSIVASTEGGGENNDADEVSDEETNDADEVSDEETNDADETENVPDENNDADEVSDEETNDADKVSDEETNDADETENVPDENNDADKVPDEETNDADETENVPEEN